MADVSLATTLASTVTSRSDFIFYFSTISLFALVALFIFYICYVVRRREIERPQTIHIPHPHPSCDVEASIASAKHSHCPRAAASRSRTRSVSASRESSRRSSRDRRASRRAKRNASSSRHAVIPVEPRVSFNHGDEESEQQQEKSRPLYSQESVPSERIFSRELVDEEGIQKRVETPEKQSKTAKHRSSSKDKKSAKSSTKDISCKDLRRGSTPDSSPRVLSSPASSKEKTPREVSAKEKTPRRASSKSPAKAHSSEPSSAPRRDSGSADDIGYPATSSRSKSKSGTKSALVSPAPPSSGSRFTEFTLPPSAVSTQQEYVSERAPFE